ncbi:hypothetical protein BCO_0900121 (plasmid) [Borrelia coriaceae ATCC 43381]|uniref:Uncharacterized protein n=1 Tax=Borrelia coriaceae ATCC 43381 TaxID=1408429 RepID=W5SXK8_9SPIR|nr:hypothetical protein BCO_0900121 [Borrelia coriaceae ATCC 43381]
MPTKGTKSIVNFSNSIGNGFDAGSDKETNSINMINCLTI